MDSEVNIYAVGECQVQLGWKRKKTERVLTV